MKNCLVAVISSLALVLAACSTSTPPTPGLDEGIASDHQIKVQASSHTSVTIDFGQIVDETFENVDIYEISADGEALRIFGAKLSQDKTTITIYTGHHGAFDYELGISNAGSPSAQLLIQKTFVFPGLSHEHEHSHAELSTQGAFLSTGLWPFQENIPVCWETNGFGQEKAWVVEAMKQTWEKEAQIRFTGWQLCSPSSEGIRVQIADEGAAAWLGYGRIDGRQNGMTLNFTYSNWWQSCRTSTARRKACIQADAVHEFGHAIGITHEAMRIDSNCSRRQGTTGDRNVGTFDVNSVMNYCHPLFTSNQKPFNLSTGDKLTVNSMYPPTTWTQGTEGIDGAVEAEDKVGKAMVSADFNNDGYLDLAVGAPGEAIGSVANAGAVHIIYGTETGLVAEGSKENTWADLVKIVVKDQLLYEDVSGGKSETNDQYGFALAAGDFDADGFADLVIGKPFEDVGTRKDAGEVSVLYGSETFGLGTFKKQIWNQTSPGIIGGVESHDQFGYALTTGDFNGDGIDDLAVGVPGEDNNAGNVNIIYGKRGSGLTSASNQRWGQDSAGIRGFEESGDRFGAALVAGDLDKDGIEDLVVGVPGEGLNNINEAGMVNVIYGKSTGLSSARNHTWTQNSLSDYPEEGDAFGSSLAIGNHQGSVSLYIGVPYEDLYVDGFKTDTGIVNIVSYESGQTLDKGIWRSSKPKSYAHYGFALTAADFNNDSNDDVAVSMPFLVLNLNGGKDQASLGEGKVEIRYSGSTKQDVWSQTRLISAAAERGDTFGYALTAGDFNKDGYPDLAVGVPHEDVGSRADAGAFNILSLRHLNPQLIP